MRAFHDPPRPRCPTDHSVDLVTTFDCIHDMTHPQEMMPCHPGARRADGTWLLVDIKARDRSRRTSSKNPMASLMYGIGVLSCMSSALPAPGGAGLGTLGLPESRPRPWPSKPASPGSAALKWKTRSTCSTKSARREHLRRFGP